MRERVNREIDGTEYGLIPVSPFKSAKILTRLIKKGAKPLLVILKDVDTKDEKTGKKKSLLDMDTEEIFPQLVEMVGPLLDNLEEDDIERIFTELIVPEYFFADGNKPNTDLKIKNYFNDHGVLHLLKVVRFALEVNFSDFLQGLPGVQEMLEKEKA